MESRVHKELPSLIALAHDRSEAARIKLASKIADLFLNDDLDLSKQEENLVQELIHELLKTNDPLLRTKLAEACATAKKMPRELALHFTKEEIETARPILLTNESFTDQDLIEIINEQSKEHACTIAERQEVSAAVADALVATGNIEVMQVIAENMGATLSTKAIAVLSNAARLTQQLQKPILNRKELSPQLAEKLYWWLTADLRRYAIKRFNLEEGQINKSLAETIEEKLHIHLLDQNEQETMENLVAWLEERGALKLPLLPELLRLRHFHLFNLALSRMANLDIQQVSVIVGEPGGRLFAALCQSLAIPKGNFISLFLLSRGARSDDQIVHPQEMSFALAAYDRLDKETATLMIENWRTNPSYILDKNKEPAARAKA